MTALTDEEHIWPERLMIRDTKLHDDIGGAGQRIYTTAGQGYKKREYVRADLAAKLSGEAGEPVAYRQMRTVRGFTGWSLSEMPHALPMVGDDVHIRGPEEPLYAHPPAEPAVVPALNLSDEITAEELRRRAIDLLKKRGWKPGDNLHLMGVVGNMVEFASEVMKTAPNSCGHPSCGCDDDARCNVSFEREITAKGRGVPADAMGDIGSDAGGPQPAPGDDLVERSTYNEARARQYISVWGPDYVQSFLAALDARITDLQAEVGRLRVIVERFYQADDEGKLCDDIDNTGAHYPSHFLGETLEMAANELAGPATLNAGERDAQR